MGYDNLRMIKDKLCLYGPLAENFKRGKLGQSVKLTITAVLKTASIVEPDSVEGVQAPYVEFEVLKVDGGKQPYGEMSAKDMEEELSDVYNNEQEPTGTSRSDGGSIWKDIKEQERLNRTPSSPAKPFAFR